MAEDVEGPEPCRDVTLPSREGDDLGHPSSRHTLFQPFTFWPIADKHKADIRHVCCELSERVDRIRKPLFIEQPSDLADDDLGSDLASGRRSSNDRIWYHPDPTARHPDVEQRTSDVSAHRNDTVAGEQSVHRPAAKNLAWAVVEVDELRGTSPASKDFTISTVEPLLAGVNQIVRPGPKEPTRHVPSQDAMK